jgi:hydrogenase expression/formation protein HypE
LTPKPGPTRLGTGKIPITLLKSTVLKMTGAASPLVKTPPRAGLDFAAIRLKDGFMVVSADPITGISEDIGYLAVKVSANDVATSGNRPQFAELVVLLPERSTEADVARFARQIHEAAKESGIAIVGGHTEVTPRLHHPIVVVTVFSFVQEYVTSGGAKDGDAIMMTKTAGLEGTAELLREKGVFARPLGLATTSKASRIIRNIDITKEAVAGFRTGRVHAMHDCTEGGVLGAVFEMSVASGIGFRLLEAAVPIAPVTRKLCRKLSLDPLKLIGSGSLLLAVPKGSEDTVSRALSPTRVTKIGEFRRGRRVLVRATGTESVVKEAPEDELWRVLGGSARRRDRL